MLVIPIKGKDLEIKFDYRLMFKANNELSEKDDRGKKQENGAGQLFVNVVERKDSAVHDLIRLAAGNNKVKIKDDDIIDAIADYAEEHGYEELFEEVEKELINSGFFLPKILKLLEDMKFGSELLSESEDKEKKEQAVASEKMLDKLQKRILLHNATALE